MHGTGMLEHPVLGVGSNNTPGRRLAAYIVFSGARHGPRVESCDLITIQIGSDMALWREHIIEHTHQTGLNAWLLMRAR